MAKIDRTIEIVGHGDGKSTITARLVFEDFGIAMKFMDCLVAFLKEHPEPKAETTEVAAHEPAQ